MNTRGGTEARDLYYEAKGLPPDARGEFLDQVCGGDGRLRGEVERLMLADLGPGAADSPTLPVPQRR